LHSLLYGNPYGEYYERYYRSGRYETEKQGFDYLWTYKYINSTLFHDLEVTTLDNDRKLLPFRIAKTSTTELYLHVMNWEQDRE